MVMICLLVAMQLARWTQVMGQCHHSGDLIVCGRAVGQVDPCFGSVWLYHFHHLVARQIHRGYQCIFHQAHSVMAGGSSVWISAGKFRWLWSYQCTFIITFSGHIGLINGMAPPLPSGGWGGVVYSVNSPQNGGVGRTHSMDQCGHIAATIMCC